MKKAIFIIILLSAAPAHSGQLENLYNSILRDADQIYNWANESQAPAKVRRYAKKIKNSADYEYIYAHSVCTRSFLLGKVKAERNKILNYANQIKFSSGNKSPYGAAIRSSANTIKAAANKIYWIAIYKSCK